MKQTVPHLAKSELVYRELREQIVSGHLAVGHRLVLGQLAREFNVSPVPVREAVRRLEAERLVVFTPNVGAEVAGVDAETYEQVMETLAYLEGAAIALSAEHITNEQIAVAEGYNERIRALMTDGIDVEDFTRLNRLFHGALWAGCRNAHLVELLEHEWERVQVIRRCNIAYRPANIAISVEQHAEILELVRSRASYPAIISAVCAHKLRGPRVFTDERAA